MNVHLHLHLNLHLYLHQQRCLDEVALFFCYTSSFVLSENHWHMMIHSTHPLRKLFDSID